MEKVKDHPSAFAFELQNEPMTIRRKWMFDAWKASAEAIVQVIPDASVSIADVGEGSVLPAWITKLTGERCFKRFRLEYARYKM